MRKRRKAATNPTKIRTNPARDAVVKTMQRSSTSNVMLRHGRFVTPKDKDLGNLDL